MKYVINDFTYDLVENTLTMNPSGSVYDYYWLANGGIIFVKRGDPDYETSIMQVTEVMVFPASSEIVTRLSNFLLEKGLDL